MAHFSGVRTRILSMLVIGAILYSFANIQRVAIPGAIFNQLQERLQVSAPCITALGAAFMYVYAVCQLVIGILIDRFGGVRTIVAGSIVFCFGVTLFSVSGTLPMLYLARMLTGLGASAFYLSLIYEVLRVFKKKSTLAVSVIIVIGYSGAVIANAPFTAAVNYWGLTNVLLFFTCLSIAAAILFAIFGLSLHLPAIRSIPLQIEPFLSVLKIPHNRYVFIFSGINWGVYYVIQTVIGKKFLEDFNIFTENQAAWVLSSLGVISAAFGFLFALFSHLAGNKRQIFCRISGAVCISVTTIGFLLILFDIHAKIAGLLFCCLAMTASISAILVPLLKETNEARLIPYAISMMNFFFYASVAIFGNLTGFLLNLFPPVKQGAVLIYSRQSYLCVFLFLFICAIPVCLYSMKIVETNGEPHLQK